MFTTKSGKSYSNPAYGKMIDDAEQAESKAKPVSKGAPVAGPDLKIVIIPGGADGSFKSKSADGEQDHADLSALLDHLKSKLGSSDEQPSDDSQDQDSDSDSDEADPSILDSVHSLMK